MHKTESALARHDGIYLPADQKVEGSKPLRGRRMDPGVGDIAVTAGAGGGVTTWIKI
jgi:hypothetical protein